MTGNLGRVMKTRLCMVTGNGNGLLGMAVLSTPFGSGAAGTYNKKSRTLVIKNDDFQAGQEFSLEMGQL